MLLLLLLLLLLALGLQRLLLEARLLMAASETVMSLLVRSSTRPRATSWWLLRWTRLP